MSKVITTIKNGLDFWFTRIIHPQIEPTNNKGEQSLREMVVMKKIKIHGVSHIRKKKRKMV